MAAIRRPAHLLGDFVNEIGPLIALAEHSMTEPV
jgi:hypothetical protein